MGGLELFWSVEMGGQRVFPLEIDEGDKHFFQKKGMIGRAKFLCQ